MDTKTKTRLPMRQVAERIDAYLRRFEADPKINAPIEGRTLHPYFGAHAWYPGGAFISVIYISFQGISHIKRADAEEYLAWLDAGNVGKHYALRK
jgi:hypothetical protein